MSDASSKTNLVGFGKVPWGPWEAIGFGLVIFLLPQILLGTILTLILDSKSSFTDDLVSGNNIATSFIIYGLSELVSLSLLYWFINRKGASMIEALRLKKPTRQQMAVSVVGFGIYFVLSIAVFAIAAGIFPSLDLEQEQVSGFESAAGIFELGLAFISLVIIAPIIEEMLFRGFVFQGLKTRFSFVISALVSSALFGLAHGQLNVAIDTFALGLVLCWLLERTQNLWPAIALHALKNGVAFALLFIIST